MAPRPPSICQCGRAVPYGVKCVCRQERDRENRARHEAKRKTSRQRGYTSKWEKARASFLKAHPRCLHVIDGEACGEPATVVHHVIAHRGDPKLFWRKSNWLPVCKACHDGPIQRGERRGDGARAHPFLPRPRIPVVVVCGPAGAGKSTYVREHAGPDDIIIDLDEIRARLSGLPMHAYAPHVTAAALEERNRILASLATDDEHDQAWFIVGAPEQAERDLWQRKLKAEVVLLDTPLDTCIARILADPARIGQHERMIGYATDWWQRFEFDRAGGIENATLRPYRTPQSCAELSDLEKGVLPDGA